jgi:hypothetical protein
MIGTAIYLNFNSHFVHTLGEEFRSLRIQVLVALSVLGIMSPFLLWPLSRGRGADMGLSAEIL